MSLVFAVFLFFLPFERLPSVEWLGFTVRLTSLLVLIFAVFFLPKLVKEKRFGPLSVLDKTLLIFLGACLLSIVGAADPSRGFVVMALLIFVFLGYLLTSRSYQQLGEDKVTTVIIISALLTGLFGLYQFFGDALGLSATFTGLMDRYNSHVFNFPRIQSVGLEPLYYANFLLLPIFLLIGRLLSKKQVSWWVSVALVFLVIVFMLTLSRGAYAAAVVGLVATISFARTTRVSFGRIGHVLLMTLLGVILGIVSVASVSGLQGVRTFSSQSLIVDAPVQSSTVSRLDHFRQAWKIFLAHPIKGVGLGSYNAVSTLPRSPEDQGRQIVNNQYLETAAETGLIGLLSLFAAGFWALHLTIRLGRSARSNSIAWGLLGAFVAVAVQFNFFSTIYILVIWVLLGLIDGANRLGGSDVQSTNGQ